MSKKHNILFLLLLTSAYGMITAGIWLSGTDTSISLILQGALTIFFSVPAIFTMDD